LKLKAALHATEFPTPNQTIGCKLRGSILETKKPLSMQQSSPTPNQTLDVSSEAVFLKIKTAVHATEFATPNQTIGCKLRGSILENKNCCACNRVRHSKPNDRM
jgi:hypothetical protein